MTSPVDTLKALVDAVEAEFCGEATERLEPDDSKVSYPEDRCHITFGHIRRAKAAIAALSGGEAEPFAWAPAGMADPRFAEQHFTVSRFQIAPGSIPLYTTPRIPDGKEPVAWRVPTPYGVGYNFASEKVMRDMADWIAHGFEHGPLDTTEQVPEGERG